MDEQRKNIFARITGLLNESAVRFAVFLLFLLIFSWPYLSFVQQASSATLFGYFFITWLVLICVLLISNSGGDSNNNNKK